MYPLKDELKEASPEELKSVVYFFIATTLVITLLIAGGLVLIARFIWY